MADYLPPVVARLSMDMGNFMAGIAKAKTAMKSLNGDMNIRVDGLDRAIAKVEALKGSMRDLDANVKVTTNGLGTFAAKTALVSRGATFAPYVAGLRLAGNTLHWVISLLAEFAAVAIPAAIALGAGLAVMAPAAMSAAEHMQALAVATSASGQMFGQSIGSVLGLSGALQQAQDAAKPAVYGILGSALIAARESMGGLSTAGLQVAQMFQQFAAKMALAFGPGGSMGGGHLLTGMVSDLRGLGQVLGNVGHLLLNVANAAPGLAEVLLKGLAGITGLASHLAGIAPLLLTVGLGFEEFSRWGGLAVGVIAKLGGTSAGLTGATLSMTRFSGILRGLASVFPLAISGISTLAARFSMIASSLSMATGEGKIASFFGSIATGAARASGALGGAAAGVRDFIAGLSGGAIAGLAALAAGIGFLIYKAVTAKTVIQQMGDSMQKAVLAASNATVMNAAINNVGQLSSRLNQVKSNAAAATAAAQGNATAMNRVSVIYKNSSDQLGTALKQQTQDMRNVAQGAQLIARTYGTTFVGALALADQAGVKLARGITGTGQAAMVARMQIQSLVQGYQAMGQSTGEVGKDMTAVAIQSGLAASGVSKLNSAWDDFTSNLTGGTTALAGLGQDLTGLTTSVTKIGNVLGKQGGSVSLGVKQFADSLKSFSGAGATAWQNFGQAVQKGQALLDWMRTAGAEGAMSARQFKQAGLDMASAFVPLAASSKTAQAELMGLVQQFDPAIKNFGQLKAAISNSGASFGGLNGIISGATQKMANMESVAQTLGNVLNSALLSALQAAQVQASGAGAAMEKYAQDLMDGNHAAAAADYGNLIGDLEKLGLSAQQAAALIKSVTRNLNNMPTSKTITITTRLITEGAAPGIAVGIPAGVRAPGHAKGTPSAQPGWAWVGEAGPELVRFRGGETVLPNQVSMGYANGAGDFGGEQHFHLYIDGRELNAAVSQRAVQTQRRTGTNGMTKRTR